jgi:hypothetical protein
MDTFLSSPNAGVTISMSIFFVSIAVISVGCTIAVQWRKAVQAKEVAELKRQMIQRGMSAEEIERVLKAEATTSVK